MEITTAVRALTAGTLLRELALRLGADVAVRVVAAPPEGGKGTISLAGQLLRAQLPPGLAANQRLAVNVARAEGGEVVLKVLHAQIGPERGDVARAAGALAVSGEGKLVELANALQQPGLALPLPNGDALQLAVGDEAAEDAAREGGGDGEAAFVLHSASLGPIEVRLRLAGGTLGASVVVDPAAEPLARDAAPGLARALARVNESRASVEVVARRPSARPAPPPLVEETFDAYG